MLETVIHLGEQSGQWGSRKTLCVVHSIVLVSRTCSRYTPKDGSDCAEDSIFQRASAARVSRAAAGKGTGGFPYLRGSVRSDVDKSPGQAKAVENFGSSM